MFEFGAPGAGVGGAVPLGFGVGPALRPAPRKGLSCLTSLPFWAGDGEGIVPSDLFCGGQRLKGPRGTLGVPKCMVGIT